MRGGGPTDRSELSLPRSAQRAAFHLPQGSTPKTPATCCVRGTPEQASKKGMEAVGPD